jgi:hypothetical protein
MRAFRVGDQFRGNQQRRIVEVTWVDPEDHFCATIFDLKGEFDDEKVFASQFLRFPASALAPTKRAYGQGNACIKAA